MSKRFTVRNAVVVALLLGMCQDSARRRAADARKPGSASGATAGPPEPPGRYRGARRIAYSLWLLHG